VQLDQPVQPALAAPRVQRVPLDQLALLARPVPQDSQV